MLTPHPIGLYMIQEYEAYSYPIYIPTCFLTSHVGTTGSTNSPGRDSKAARLGEVMTISVLSANPWKIDNKVVTK